ncbi:hypothetical protein J6590_045875 [Homalodisca vitripennis]|nr:hypothetical protein J6590_045875 [Homalodisca vitripennis]
MTQLQFADSHFQMENKLNQVFSELAYWFESDSDCCATLFLLPLPTGLLKCFKALRKLQQTTARRAQQQLTKSADCYFSFYSKAYKVEPEPVCTLQQQQKVCPEVECCLNSRHLLQVEAQCKQYRERCDTLCLQMFGDDSPSTGPDEDYFATVRAKSLEKIKQVQEEEKRLRTEKKRIEFDALKKNMEEAEARKVEDKKSKLEEEEKLLQEAIRLDQLNELRKEEEKAKNRMEPYLESTEAEELAECRVSPKKFERAGKNELAHCRGVAANFETPTSQVFCGESHLGDDVGHLNSTVHSQFDPQGHIHGAQLHGGRKKQVISIDPTFVSSYYRCQKVRIILTTLQHVLGNIQSPLLLLVCQQFWHKFCGYPAQSQVIR